MDDAEILITDRDSMVAQAELLLSGDIEYLDGEPAVTPKGFERAWDFLKTIPPTQRALLCLFFVYLQEIDKEA